MSTLRRFFLDEGGQDLIEYALLATFVALAAYTAVTELGGAVSYAFAAVAEELEEAP
jgi:Flp pilus assembly pilin Flp